MQAVAYYRTSGKTGRSNAGEGLDLQRKTVRAYCRENDIGLTGEFVDDGISGIEAKLEKRKGLIDLLANLNGEDLVVVKSTDRLWRDDYSRVILTRELKKIRKDVRAVDNPSFSLYEDNPSDYLINGMMTLLDTYQRMEISLKLYRARRNRVKRTCQKANGRAPLGYKWNHEKKTIEVDDEKKELIPIIFNQYLKLKSLNKLRMYLMENYDFNMSNVGLSKLLRNDFYIGVVRYGDVVEKEGRHEPLISLVQFGKVQSMLRRNRKKKGVQR
jgi:site-specific DNA recombinase